MNSDEIKTLVLALRDAGALSVSLKDGEMHLQVAFIQGKFAEPAITPPLPIPDQPTRPFPPQETEDPDEILYASVAS
jgi:hypothetical protein